MPRQLAMNHFATAWCCVFCPQLRLAPWGRPIGTDRLVAECPTCGDICATGDPTHALRALAHVIVEQLL